MLRFKRLLFTIFICNNMFDYYTVFTISNSAILLMVFTDFPESIFLFQFDPFAQYFLISIVFVSSQLEV